MSAAAATTKADAGSADFPSQFDSHHNSSSSSSSHSASNSSVEGWGVRLVRGPDNSNNGNSRSSSHNGGGNGATSKGGLSAGAFVCEFVGRLAPANRSDIAAALARKDR